MTEQKKTLTVGDIERYAARFGDHWAYKIGVLLATVENLMSDDKGLRESTQDRLREWAGGETPKT